VPESHVVDELSRRRERIQQLTGELAKCQRNAMEQQELADRINREILAARQALQPLP
jgi:hypothetical protein